MIESLRNSGIDIIGDVPWGTHFCQFYQTKDDLMDILVTYFKAGLENNEFCMWVTSQPLSIEDAKEALRRAVPDIDIYLEKGQIEIIPYTHWYVKKDAFDSQRVLNGWVEKLNQALANGYDGLRLTGNTFWLENKDWNNFVDYEEEVDRVIGNYQMIALCTYSLDRCNATEIIDVVNNHQFALIKRDGKWEQIESSKRQQAERELLDANKRIQLKSDELLKKSNRLQVQNEKLQILSFELQTKQEEFKLQNEKLQAQSEEIQAQNDELQAQTEELRLANEALIEGERQSKLLIEHAPSGIFEIDFTNLRYNSVNDAMCRILGYSREELLTLNPFNLLDDEGKIKFRERVSKLLAGYEVGNEVEYRMIGKNGRIVCVLLNMTYRFKNGKVTGALVVLHDITERKRMEEALRESEEQLRFASEGAGFGIYDADLVAGTIYWSPEMRTILGLPADFEPILNTMPEFIHPDDVESVRQMYHEAFDSDGSGVFDNEHRIIRLDGSIRWVQFIGQSIFEGEGIQRHAVRVSGVMKDITERKRYEKNLSFLSEISAELVGLDNIEDTMEILGEKIGRHFDVKWCMFAEITENLETSVVSNGWSDKDVQSLKGTYRMRDFLSDEQLARNNAGELSIVSDTQTDPHVSAEMYGALGIISFIINPISCDGQWCFQLSIIDNKQREWHEDEIELLKEIANCIWTRLERARAEEALRESRILLENELTDTKLLQAISAEFLPEDNIQELYEKIIDAAMQIMHSDYASMQMLYPERGKGGELRLLAFHGFSPEAAKFWEWVSADSESSCGIALRTGKRVIAPDIENCDFMDGSEDQGTYIQSGIHAVQTTPLVSRSGKLVGMISTHWRKPHNPTERDWRLWDILTRQAADLIDRKRAEEALKNANETLEERVRERTGELKRTSEELEKRNQELIRERQRLYDVLETLPAMVCLLTPDYHIDFANRSFREKYGESEGRHCYEYCFGRTEPCEFCETYKVLETGQPHHWECNIPSGGVVDAYDFPFTDVDGSPLILEMDLDITERRKAEEALAKIEIARKQEIHHRIKNNLQVISSLLDLQAEKFRGKTNIEDSQVLESFKESQDRVISMALIHEELHKGGEIDTLNFSQYIKELADNLFLTYKVEKNCISLNMNLEEDIFFNMDTAIPLGIIINELISNSLKYAFQGRDKGEIRIELHRDRNSESENESMSTNFVLSVLDNGVGIPEDIEIEDLDSLGLQLVTTLVDQLDGELELKRDNSTEFIIKFTVIEENKQASAPAPQLVE